GQTISVPDQFNSTDPKRPISTGSSSFRKQARQRRCWSETDQDKATIAAGKNSQMEYSSVAWYVEPPITVAILCTSHQQRIAERTSKSADFMAKKASQLARSIVSVGRGPRLFEERLSTTTSTAQAMPSKRSDNVL